MPLIRKHYVPGIVVALAIAFPAGAAEKAATCVAPKLEPERGGKGWPASLRSGPDLARLRAAVGEAVAAACKNGTLGAGGLKNEAGKSISLLLVRNAPDANILSIYPDDGGAMLIEYPFFRAGGAKVEIPDKPAIQEALYCYAKGATPQEEETEGRCLPD